VSLQAMQWVFEESLTEGNDRLVMLAIADAANKQGEEAYPGVDTIARYANVSQRTVQRSIRRCVELGELRVELKAGGSADLRNDRRPNRYTVLMHGVTPVTPRTDAELTRASQRRARDDHPDDPTLLSPRDDPTTRQPCHLADGHEVTPEASRGDSRRAHEVTQLCHPTQEKTPKTPASAAANGDRHAGHEQRRQRDDLWDAFVETLGWSPQTKAERGKWNTALKQLRELGATDDDIRRRVREYRQRGWPECNPMAVVAHWGELGPRARPIDTTAPRAAPVDRPGCPTCGVAGVLIVDGVVRPCPDCTPALEEVR